ncbi:MAG TPA: alpha-L-fucosidase [Verrucomicrobiae bacterium]|nr:alpha-L-fucosidase [Verrucomicrobiae bacterium]
MNHPAKFVLSLAGCWLAVLGSVLPVAAQMPPADSGDTPAQHDQRMAWFRDARFGMFIHWGVYSVPAGEWDGKTDYAEWIMESAHIPVSRYEQFAQQFNPVKFNAQEWVRMAKDAGMKYIVITSKHHDGFGMWPSRLSDWNIGRTPFHRDPLKELSVACQAAGIKFCLYHSIMDWHHPDWGQRRPWNDLATGTPDMDRYTAYMKGQLKELLTGYGPIGILWFDGEWEKPWTHERGVDLYHYVRSLQPDIIINNRVGKGRTGMEGMDQGAERVGDYGTPEQQIPATGFGPGVDWESCMTMNDHWGYNKNDTQWKSTQTLVRNLIDCASKGGNYLLNVGPTAEGVFPAPSIERLAEIGRWMKVNRESIYGTSASPFKRLTWGRCTTKSEGANTTLYLHVFDWPKDGELLVPGLKNAVNSARLLATGVRLDFKSTADGVRIVVPAAAPDAIASVIALSLKGTPEVDQVTLRQDARGEVNLPATEATLHGHTVRVESAGQNLGFWTDPSDWAEWQFKIVRAGRFQVEAEMASLGEGRFEISLGDQKIRGIAPATGAYQKYRVVTLGTVELPAGEFTLALRPLTEHWQPVNLKSILLTP